MFCVNLSMTYFLALVIKMIVVNPFLHTAGVLDFLGCAWWPFCPPLGMYTV
jgi:hypothetical protein